MDIKTFVFIYFGIQIATSKGLLSLSRRKGHCNTKLADRTNVSCSDYYYDHYPYKDKHNLDKDCKIRFTPDSKEYFTYKVNKFKYRFVNLRLSFCNMSSVIQYTRCAIQPLEWVWTFGGAEGGVQYLGWPTEFETLSLGMLKKHTSEPLNVNVTTSGKCKVIIGELNTTERFALAFADFHNDLAMKNDQYNYSHWCFKTRIYIRNKWLYYFCLQVLCPIETIGYKCCKQLYNVTSRNMTIQCPGESIGYGSVWWIGPFVIGVVLYLYFALIFLWVLSNVSKHLNVREIDQMFMDTNSGDKTQNKPHETTPLLGDTQELVWTNHNPVTIFSILAYPLRRCWMLYPNVTARTMRLLLTFSSLTVVTIKILVHLQFHKDYIIDSVKMGSLMDFSSMIAGYYRSRKNFLRFLGGPYVALTSYVLCLIVLIVIPRDFTRFIESGFPTTNANVLSPLWLDLKLRERFGSRKILCPEHKGVTRIQKTMLANILSLLNPSFWGYTLNLQISRFRGFICKLDLNVCTYLLIPIVFVPYIIVCAIELLLTVVMFGFPTIFGICMVCKAYIIALLCWRNTSYLGKCVTLVFLPVLLLMLFLVVYMFSIIFVDSFIFIAKVVIFTYTGLFVDPNYTAGWVVFGITVSMYIYESIHSVNDTYEQLFTQTRKVCKRKAKRLHIKQLLYKKEVEGPYVPMDVYKYIVQNYKPIRVEVFASFVKICLIIFCLYISLRIVTNFEGFQSLSIVTQTATTIFVSLVPKILKRMCHLNERRKLLRMRLKISGLVESYLIYTGIKMGNISDAYDCLN